MLIIMLLTVAVNGHNCVAVRCRARFVQHVASIAVRRRTAPYVIPYVV